MNPDLYSTFDTQRFDNLDDVSKTRYLEMIEEVPEPDWEAVSIRLISALKKMRDDLSEHGPNTVMRAPAIARLLNMVLNDPHIASDGFTFLEHTKQSMDIILLEQLMSLE